MKIAHKLVKSVVVNFHGDESGTSETRIKKAQIFYTHTLFIYVKHASTCSRHHIVLAQQ